jgi:hypothetical protein
MAKTKGKKDKDFKQYWHDRAYYWWGSVVGFSLLEHGEDLMFLNANNYVMLAYGRFLNLHPSPVHITKGKNSRPHEPPRHARRRRRSHRSPRRRRPQRVQRVRSTTSWSIEL